MDHDDIPISHRNSQADATGRSSLPLENYLDENVEYYVNHIENEVSFHSFDWNTNARKKRRKSRKMKRKTMTKKKNKIEEVKFIQSNSSLSGFLSLSSLAACAQFARFDFHCC